MPAAFFVLLFLLLYAMIGNINLEDWMSGLKSTVY